MEISAMWEQLINQDAMFWTAIGSVGLGATLILIAGVAQFRRFQGKHLIKNPDLPPRKAKPTAAPTGTPLEIIHAATPTSGAAVPGLTPQSPEMQELAELLGRLKSVARKLDDCRHLQEPGIVHPPESPLKEAGNGVDYVFRAGTG